MPRAVSGTNSTGHSRVDSLRAPSRATVRSAALRPIDAAGREIARRARGVVPVIALHAGVVLGDQRARQRVARAALGAAEAERIRVRGHRRAGLHRCAFGIVDARIERAAGVLDLDAEPDRVLGA